MSTNKRPIALFQFKNFRRITLFIAKMRNIILNFTNNSLIFTTPTPTVAVVTGHVDDLDDAQAEAMTRASGAVALRNQKKAVVTQDIYDWLMYVQQLADDAPDEETAILIIQAAGFSVKVKGVFVKPPLEVKNGIATGTVELTAKGGPAGSFHEWQSSTNGVNWTNQLPTKKAKTLIAGLTRLSTVYFRHRLNIKDVPQEWSQPVNIVVL